MSTDLASASTLTVQGVTVPAFMYGTAWKEQRTQALTAQALDAGFRAIDTANQRKHYFEEGAGQAVQQWLAAGGEREELFLQTKFTYPRGQDHRLPYSAGAPVEQQLLQSFESSLQHLGVARLDSLLLHGPESREGLSESDWRVWRGMEALKSDGRVRLIGVSNVSAEQLASLLDGADTVPAFVQNRCYAKRGWDRDVRALCHSAGVVYQGFSLLTANRKTWNHRRVAGVARRLGATPAQVLFRLALQLGILPLTGSSDARHLGLDLLSRELELSEADVALIRAVEG